MFFLRSKLSRRERQLFHQEQEYARSVRRANFSSEFVKAGQRIEINKLQQELYDKDSALISLAAQLAEANKMNENLKSKLAEANKINEDLTKRNIAFFTKESPGAILAKSGVEMQSEMLAEMMNAAVQLVD